MAIKFKTIFHAILLRFKNYGFCVSVFALIPVVCQTLGFEINLGEYEAVINGVLAFLVAAGLVSNPTTENRWYSDDTK